MLAVVSLIIEVQGYKRCIVRSKEEKAKMAK
jgi:hypothetical protein